MNHRIEYRFWERTNWHDETSPLIAVYCNIVDGCDPTVAISDFEFCTGLKDKNGNLIYEGDLIKDWRESKYVVKWLDDYAQFFAENIDDNTDGWHFEKEIFEHQIEIIGNIHEQKEQQ